MAGPAKYLVQLALAGAQIVGRAFARALREEIRNSQNAAASRGGTTRDTSRAAAVSSRMGMTAQEAKQILNIGSKDNKLELQELQEKYDHLFKANDKAVGGSFYLQSKVVRAKERLEEELRLSSAAEAAKQSTDAADDTSRRARRRSAGSDQKQE